MSESVEQDVVAVEEVPIIRTPKIGGPVMVYEHGVTRVGLVQAVHGEASADYQPLVNVAAVSTAPSVDDVVNGSGYGRGLVRITSIPHRSQGAGSLYWTYLDEPYES